MERAYHMWYSSRLGREMELLVFGAPRGARTLVFPTRGGRFYDYEDWGLARAARPRVEAGALQLFCVDSVDHQGLYADPEERTPRERIEKHLAYQAYILEEVLPFTQSINTNPTLVAHGCSLGAYHAVNLALRRPELFRRVVALSGRYDLTVETGPYRDLFDGYYDDDIYYNNPAHFLGNMWDPTILADLRKLEVTLAVGLEDACYLSNCRMNELLEQLHIPHRLNLWEGEAHRARYWRQMIVDYL